MSRTKSAPTNRRADNNDLINERFHALLREAAERREERALVKSTQDDAAAKQESADLMALARSEAGMAPRFVRSDQAAAAIGSGRPSR